MVIKSNLKFTTLIQLTINKNDVIPINNLLTLNKFKTLLNFSVYHKLFLYENPKKLKIRFIFLI